MTIILIETFMVAACVVTYILWETRTCKNISQSQQ